MNKQTLILACLLLIPAGSSAAMGGPDRAAEGTVYRPCLGVEGAVDLSSLYGRSLADVLASYLDFMGGAFLIVPTGKLFAFQPEILYEQKGGKLNGGAYQMDYVEVPLLLDFTPAGPAGVLLGPSINTHVANQGLVDVNRLDLGLILGVQLRFSDFIVSNRYEVGLTQTGSSQQIQNGVFTFLIGLSLI